MDLTATTPRTADGYGDGGPGEPERVRGAKKGGHQERLHRTWLLHPGLDHWTSTLDLRQGKTSLFQVLCQNIMCASLLGHLPSVLTEGSSH
ncbi:hypothetical protein EOD39_7257 [Acipenser ruthenus]|uniref:Uncharacterized protein n=1 Tax=Acipenser ruthenus TaxID=7906 RepID=A0A444U7E2_ACIRT|nr:hypothetical protein EOD39_7257 [Acipenser ruthenus]